MRPIAPESIDVTKAWIEAYLDGVHTTFPGRIESYDPAKQVADIQPLIRYPVEQPDGSLEYEELPVISTCPVIFPRTTSGWFFALPMDVGDTVLVVAAELPFAHWRQGNGDVEYPGDLRRHHMANAVAIPGMFVTSKALAHAPPKLSDVGSDHPAIAIGKDVASGQGPRVELRKGGDITIIPGDGVLSLGDVPSVTKAIIGDGEAMRTMLEHLEAMCNDLKTQFNKLRMDFNSLAGTASCSVGGGPITFSVGWPTQAAEVSEADIEDPPAASTKVKAI